jgi:hypothetical protein
MTFRIQQNDIDQNYIQKNDILQKLNQDINNNLKSFAIPAHEFESHLTEGSAKKKRWADITFFAKFDN